MSRGPSALGSLRRLAPGILAAILVAAYPVGALADANKSAFQIAAFDAFPQQSSFVTIGDVAYFEASDPSGGTSLWKSDGTAAGTKIVKQVSPTYYCCPQYETLTSVGETLYFAAYEPATGDELWKSDGTPERTQLVVDLVPGSDGSAPSQLTASGGNVFFAAYPAHGGDYLFRSDGTAEGTQQQLSASHSEIFMYSPHDLTDVDGTLYFNAENVIDNEFGLWKTDGTPEGTLLVGPSGGELARVNGILFFTRGYFTEYTGLVYELWKSDGADRVLVVKQIEPEVEFLNWFYGPFSLTDVNGTLFFTAQYSSYERALWKSDGTPDGTQRFSDPFVTSEGPSLLTNVDGTLFFVAEDGAHGEELWRSDGTGPGTQIVKDIRTGTAGSGPSSLADVGGKLLFTACDDVAGCEPWITSPTYPGAVRVADIVPGPDPSNPMDFTRVGNRVLFRVRPDLALPNWELWVAPVSALSLECSDGIDDDGDGLIDFDGGAAANGGVALGFPDPGCYDGSLISTETAPCQNGLDDDGDGLIDYDGGATANHGAALAMADPECTQPWRNTERPALCGLGAELAFAMPLLALLRRGRWSRVAQQQVSCSAAPRPQS